VLASDHRPRRNRSARVRSVLGSGIAPSRRCSAVASSLPSSTPPLSELLIPRIPLRQTRGARTRAIGRDAGSGLSRAALPKAGCPENPWPALLFPAFCPSIPCPLIARPLASGAPAHQRSDCANNGDQQAVLDGTRDRLGTLCRDQEFQGTTRALMDQLIERVARWCPSSPQKPVPRGASIAANPCTRLALLSISSCWR